MPYIPKPGGRGHKLDKHNYDSYSSTITSSVEWLAQTCGCAEAVGARPGAGRAGIRCWIHTAGLVQGFFCWTDANNAERTKARLLEMCVTIYDSCRE